MAEGYSMKGSQANSVALNPADSCKGGKRFSVAGPVRGFPLPANAASPMRKATATDNRCLSIFICRPGFISVSWLSAENASHDNSHNPTGEEAQAHGILFPNGYP